MRADSERNPGSAERICSRLSALHEPPLKLGYLRDALRRLSAREVVELLGLALGERGRARTSDEVALLTLLLLAGPESSDIRREALARQASSVGLSEVAFFVAPRPDEVPELKRSQLPYEGRPLTLGERKSLARGRDRELLTRVIRDPHPDVIGIILRNPALTEMNVIRLAARPTSSLVLRAILGALPWCLHYQIRLALMQNPMMPLGLAVPLVASLRHPDATALSKAGSLRPELRQAAHMVMQRIHRRSH
ncbi:MAG: hypothetical protein ACI9KE_001560 [Polyangiales bacterium]|jgi:hypothetical protein